MSNQLLEAGLAAMGFSRRNTLTFFEDIPKDKICHQPFPGANHALWVLGHLAATDDFFLRTFSGKSTMLPEKWGPLFGMGSIPTPHVRDYPAVEEILSLMRPMREGLIGWFQSLTPDQLLKPLPPDWQKFGAHTAQLMFGIAWHEGMHAGQLTVIRKSLGLKPKVG